MASACGEGEVLSDSVRIGVGVRGLWISLGDRTERQILFEGGSPVATNSTETLSFEKTGDLFLTRVDDERFEIPDAAVSRG